MRRLTIVVLLLATEMMATGSPPPDAGKQFYNKVAERIGPFWFASMKKHGKHIAAGTVRVGFTLAHDGRLMETHVMSNTSDKLAADLAVDAIKHAKFPTVPTELLSRGVYRTNYTFTVFSDDTKRSNQSLQPTASPRADLHMTTSTFQFAARLATISGG